MRTLACLLIVVLTTFLAASAQTVSAGPSAETSVLPIWREIFARPDTRLESLPSPTLNPITEAKVRLGEALFFDTRLSGDETRACSTCHEPGRGFTDGLTRAAAIDGKTQLANSPSLLNLAWASHFFWDGRADSLEQQVSQPILNRQEMAGTWPEIVRRLSNDKEVVQQFSDAFGPDAEVSPATITKALASYVRSIVSAPDRFDRFIEGDSSALSETEKEGFFLFVGKGGCAGCHWGWRFSDDRLHLTGIGQVPIKTPGLRGLSKTGPYMHDGSKGSLEAVIGHYTALGDDRSLSPNLVRPLQFGDHEVKALVAFLKAL